MNSEEIKKDYSNLAMLNMICWRKKSTEIPIFLLILAKILPLQPNCNSVRSVHSL